MVLRDLVSINIVQTGNKHHLCRVLWRNRSMTVAKFLLLWTDLDRGNVISNIFGFRLSLCIVRGIATGVVHKLLIFAHSIWISWGLVPELRGGKWKSTVDIPARIVSIWLDYFIVVSNDFLRSSWKCTYKMSYLLKCLVVKQSTYQ